MKMYQCLVYSCVLYCILDVAGADFFTFITNLPSEVGSAVSTAWNNIVTAIKKPVWIRNVRRSKRRTTTTASSDNYKSTAISEQYPVVQTYQTEADTNPISMADEISSTVNDLNPKIPIINQPQWKSMKDWTNLQRPSLAQLIETIRERRRETTTTVSVIENTTKNSKTVGVDDEDNHFATTKVTTKQSPSVVPSLVQAKRNAVERYMKRTPAKEKTPITTKEKSVSSTEGAIVPAIQLGKLRINFHYKLLFV